MSPEVRARLERIVAEGRRSAPGADAVVPATPPRETLPDELDEGRPRRALRPSFERRHLLVVAAVVLIGLVITGGWLIRAREVATIEVETTAPGAVDTPSTPVQTEPAPTERAAPVLIRVHVLGAVVTPGVVEVPEGSRVADAIGAAGGLADHAQPGDLNLAAPVPDGAQIWVGDRADPGGEVRVAGQVEGPTGATPSGPAPPGDDGGLVNLNTATGAQLETLPGVGPVMAGNIIAWRTANGRFDHVDQLQEVDGIGPKTFQRLAPLVTV